VRDANNLELEGTYDLILSASALHHVENLEDLIIKLRSMLNPGGYFAFSEYVGPNRFQWTDEQISIVNGILNVLDPYYLKNGERSTFVPSTVEDMIRVDPSEAVRSSDILRLAKKYFHVEYERNFYLNIVHPLFPMLNTNLSNKNNGDFDSIIRLLLYFEKLLVDKHVLESDCVFMVCRVPDGSH
jgi:SAM-dependent methyltransferase